MKFFTRKNGLAVLLALVAVVAVGSGVGVALAQNSGAFHWESLHVTVEVLPGGKIDVVEEHAFRFEVPYTDDIFWAMPMHGIDGISNVSVTRDGRTVSHQSGIHKEPGAKEGSFYVYWQPGSLNPPETRTFQLKYRASGVFESDGSGGYSLRWLGMLPDREGEILNSSITVRVPDNATHLLDEAVVYGAQDYRQARVGSNAVRFTPEGKLAKNQGFGFGLSGPGDVLGITGQPGWQSNRQQAVVHAEIDAAAKKAKQARNREIRHWMGWSFRIAGLVGLPIMGMVIWQRRKWPSYHLDIPDSVSQPPSDLPPGAVALLRKRRADGVTLLTVLVDMCRKGILEVECIEGLGNKPYRINKVGAAKEPWERIVEGAVPNDRVSRQELLEFMRSKADGIGQALGETLAMRGLFSENPYAARKKAAPEFWIFMWVIGLILLSLGAGGWVSLVSHIAVGVMAMLLAGCILGFAFPGRVGKLKPTEQGISEMSDWVAYQNKFRWNFNHPGNDLVHVVAADALEEGHLRNRAPSWFKPRGWGRDSHNIHLYLFSGWGLQSSLNHYGQVND